MTLRFCALIFIYLVLCIPVNSYAETPVAKVIVQESGAILLDGKPTSLDELQARFAELSAQGGEVWYHRANPTGEPPASATQVIQLVIDARLPIRLAIDADFTRFMGPEGEVQSK